MELQSVMRRILRLIWDGRAVKLSWKLVGKTRLDASWLKRALLSRRNKGNIAGILPDEPLCVRNPTCSTFP